MDQGVILSSVSSFRLSWGGTKSTMTLSDEKNGFISVSIGLWTRVEFASELDFFHLTS